MDFHDSKKTFEAMAESVKDADAIKELMLRAGIHVNNVTLVLIDSMRRASFDAGREAMREEAAQCAREHADIHTRRGETDGGAHNIGYCRGRHDVALDIARAIRALPGKEGE